MLQCYCSHVHSKEDYGSFICGFIMKFRSSVIDPVHNTGTSLATGAFQASHLGSLYLESGEPPQESLMLQSLQLNHITSHNGKVLDERMILCHYP
jgi:hypothetical protein